MQKKQRALLFSVEAIHGRSSALQHNRLYCLLCLIKKDVYIFLFLFIKFG
jgi:hypothetical protein